MSRQNYWEVSHLRTWLVFAVATLVLALACATVTADPYLSIWETETAESNITNSWVGSTGMVMTPKATTCVPQGMIGSFHWIDVAPNAADIWSVNIGITANLEIGAARLSQEWTGAASEVIANAKYNIDLGRWTENPQAPQAAIGVWDIGNAANRTYYLVLTQDMTIPEEGQISNLRASIGYGDTDANAGAMDGIFGGIEFVPFESGLVKLEYDAENFNAALCYSWSDRVSLEIASIDGDLGAGINFQTGF